MTAASLSSRLELKRREQTPQAVARLTVISLFIALWGVLWVSNIPMPVPFLVVLILEALFFVAWLRLVSVVPTVRGVELAHYIMLGAEIVFHTTMVYFLGGPTWLGALAYVFALVFTNTFLDLRRGFIYTSAVAAAVVALMLLEASGTIPHYNYLDEGGLRVKDPQLVVTSALGLTGVFYSIFLWVNWVGLRLRQDRDAAVSMQDALYDARAELQRANEELEHRVDERTRELQLANAALEESDELLRATIESTADGILVVDGDGHVAYANTQFLRMWRIPDELAQTGDDDALLACVLDQLRDPDAFVARVRELYGDNRPDLDTLWFKDNRVFERFSRPLLEQDARRGRVWSFRDVTEQKRTEELLRQRARRDTLTGMLNHAAITEAVREAATAHERIAAVMVDVDGMKAVNDTFGHQLGDAVLTAVVKALADEGAVVGRYGGDEFLVLLPGRDRDAARAYCDAVMERLNGARVHEPLTGSEVPVIASLGLAVYPDEAESTEDLIRLADNAMYSDKRDRRRESMDGSRLALEDERAARMVGEIVPLLTSSRDLGEKLRMVGHHLSVGAGYDFVRFDTTIGDGGSPRYTTFTRLTMPGTYKWDEPNDDGDLGRAVLDTIRRTKRPVIIDDLMMEERLSEEQRQLLEISGLRTGAVIPMLWQGKVLGLLAVGSTKRGSISARDVQFLCAVADQVTAIIRMEALVGELQSATSVLQDARSDTVVMLAAAAEAHDGATGKHLHRVREISEQLALELGYEPLDAAALGLAAVLHDIGKIRVPETILLSPSQLSDAEWDVMKQHTTWGAEFLAGRPEFELAATIARCHHERWDGAGYPQGLRADEIPEAAAIVTVADSVDAMTNDRPYRTGRPVSWAVAEVVRCGGAQFNPRVVAALQRLHARGELVLNSGQHSDDAGHRAA